MVDTRTCVAPPVSALPRWSHRDPVEGGNPFPSDDPRQPQWDAATRTAKETLVRFDADLEKHARPTSDPAVYRTRVIALAEARFDVWASRGLSVVHGADALREFECWLAAYAANWLRYVSDTCPRVEMGSDLRTRLTERQRYWAAKAEQLVGR